MRLECAMKKYFNHCPGDVVKVFSFWLPASFAMTLKVSRFFGSAIFPLGVFLICLFPKESLAQSSDHLNNKHLSISIEYIDSTEVSIICTAINAGTDTIRTSGF